MYVVVLDLRRRPEARGVDRAHAFVLGKTAAALTKLAPGAACDGTSDLTLPAPGDGPRRKFAGNSLRVRRDHLLYHGAILYDFPLERITRWLAMPARQPCYRQQRSHEDFLTNLPATREAIAAALVDAWQANEPLVDWPRERTRQLAASRYASLDWSAPRSAPATP
jgi:lipoate-protein ligase A